MYKRQSHGRFGDQADLDLTRTVGWLTSIYPQHVSLPANATLAECIIAVSYTHLDVYKRQALYRGIASTGMVGKAPMKPILNA